jgi:hypothetical protein
MVTMLVLLVASNGMMLIFKFEENPSIDSKVIRGRK